LIDSQTLTENGSGLFHEIVDEGIEVAGASESSSHAKKRSNSAADFRRLAHSCSLGPHSAKTYGNLVRGTACRNTDEFPVPVREALIGLSVDF
jgi:hypothetical protein